MAIEVTVWAFRLAKRPVDVQTKAAPLPILNHQRFSQAFEQHRRDD